MGRRQATECVHGHRYTEANRYVDGKGKQRCLICIREQERSRPKRDRTSRKTARCALCGRAVYPSMKVLPDGQRVQQASQTCADCRGWMRRAA
jgi:hypothetical protein